MSIKTEAIQKLVAADPQLKFLPTLIELAVRLLSPKSIILFGSRSTAKATRTSDVDLFFDMENANPEQWGRFAAEAREDLRTLLDVDLVRSDTASREILASVAAEGKVIYER